MNSDRVLDEEANIFAMELLMPFDWISNDIKGCVIDVEGSPKMLKVWKLRRTDAADAVGEQPPMDVLKVWKQVLQPDTYDIEVPAGTEFLTAREQGDDVVVWYRCNPDAPMERRKIATVGTGHSAPAWRYLGSAQLRGGSLVFHVFAE